jgi:type IV fimbrial biogenesis protein FimT
MDIHGQRSLFQRGLTVVELLVSMAVVTVLLAIAVPSFSDMLDASRLRGAEDNLTAYLRFAKAESTKRNRSISLTLQANADGSDWCYGLSEDADCDCFSSGSCVYDGVERVAQDDDYGGVQITITVSHGRFSFQPKRNTVTAGSVTFIAANGKQLKTVVSGYGRIRHCSPPGDVYLPGFPEC